VSRSPRVTIGLPVFNGERYLHETLRSILDQSFEDLEVLVADNASTDATRDIVHAVESTDPRVRLIPSDTNRGAAWNYNRLVEASSAELFKWAGYDDLLDPSYLQRCVESLDRDPGAVLSYPETEIIDANGRVVSKYEERLIVDQGRPEARVAAVARRLNLCNACFGVMRRERMVDTGLIRPFVSSDVTFLAEMAALGRFARVGDTLFQRRVHATSSRQGHTTLDAVARWFDTSKTRAPRAPRLHLALATARALAELPAPAVTKVSTSLSFLVVYGLRRARISLGRARAHLGKRQVDRPELIHTIEEQS
jgi:glycosyltransferase involved in cell wall biosynthesis